MQRTKIAMVVSTVGYHWEEFFGAWDELDAAGIGVDVFTVDGAAPKPDPLSLRHTGPLTLFGLGISARIDPATPRGREAEAALAARRPLAELATSAYEAIYLPGGHGCLFDVNRDATLHGKLVALHGEGKILSAVCHATSALALATVDGRSIAAGKRLTGFPQALDDVLIRAHAVHEGFLPLPFSNERVLRERGVDVPKLDALRGSLNPRHHFVSLPFVTGVGPKSARPVARAVIAELRRRRGERAAA